MTDLISAIATSLFNDIATDQIDLSAAIREACNGALTTDLVNLLLKVKCSLEPIEGSAPLLQGWRSHGLQHDTPTTVVLILKGQAIGLKLNCNKFDYLLPNG